MTRVKLAGLALFVIGGFGAARALRYMAVARRAKRDGTPPAASGSAEGRKEPASIARTSAPYEGVARRKPASGVTTCQSPVLRPKS